MGRFPRKPRGTKAVGTVVVRPMVAYVGRIRNEASEGFVILHENTWRFSGGSLKDPVVRDTIDWRIVVGEDEWTTASSLSIAEAQDSLGGGLLAFGEYAFTIQDIPTSEERSRALLMFVEQRDANEYAVAPLLEDFLGIISR